jgi:hypothetical protein
MTVESLNKSDVPEGSTTLKVETQREMPELEAIIRGVLELHDGLCMNVAEERQTLSVALASTIRSKQQEALTDEPGTEAAT